MVQFTIINLPDYGKWSHTLGNDREHIMQMFQSSLYGMAQKLFSKIGGIVLPSRWDEIFAVTNGIAIKDHAKICNKLSLSFPFKISMAVGSDLSPLIAHEKAYLSRELDVHKENSKIFGTIDNNQQQSVTIIHADIEGQTEISKTITPFDLSSLMLKIHYKMSEFFVQYNSLTFYMGGDNFMIIADEKADRQAIEFVDFAYNNLGISFNCGIGKAHTGREAAMLATTSLDTIRKLRSLGKKNSNVLEIQKINDEDKQILDLRR